MKKIFLLILMLPLFVMAEAFPPGRVASEGDSPTANFKNGGASAATVGADQEKPCPMCKHPKNVRLNNKRTNAGSAAAPEAADPSIIPVETGN